MSSRLDRYVDLVDDAKAFQDACRAPLPETCWMPAAHRVAFDVLKPSGLDPLPWTDSGFRIRDKDVRFGAHFLLGGLLIQEEAAMMAIHTMGLRPGEHVLDLCAAPGNKTVQLASAVGPGGVVVANDVSAARLQVLRGLVDRFRFPGVYLTVHDGTSFPDRTFGETGIPVRFDAVLADVPCSCEGTCRKNPSVLDPGSRSRQESLPDLQEALLRRAILLARPGGRILYATCTFAPEENEEVVNRILQQPGLEGAVRVESFSIPGVHLDPGIDSWNGQVMDASLTRTARIWPHRNDTGGFYLALLRKEGSALDRDWPVTHGTSLPADELPWSAYTLDSDFLGNHQTLPDGQKHNRLVAAHVPDLPFNVVSRGMSGLNLKSRDPRPTSSLAALLAGHAHTGIAELPEAGIVPFLLRETVRPRELVAPADRTRYVLVRCGPLTLGLGHVDAHGNIESLFPTQLAGLPVRDWMDGLGGPVSGA